MLEKEKFKKSHTHMSLPTKFSSLCLSAKRTERETETAIATQSNEEGTGPRVRRASSS